ncbi:MAG: VTT domain-containing protein [Cyclobacteriaceae bacterium]|nr:VTT domain-containing protein [Cyclobacteriaceae bacterium]
MSDDSRGRFFLKNFIRGIAFLIVFITVFILFKRYVSVDYLSWLKPVYENTLIVFLIYTVSEIVFGIIPPEVFFIWSTRSGDVVQYVYYIFLLALISYAAGILGFWIGVKLNQTIIYRWIKRRYLLKYQKYLNKYGFFLIIVASLTPLPYSAISMLMGSVSYPFKKYALYALFRFLRYGVYSIIFWEINTME